MLVEMDIKTVVIGGGPVSSLIVLMPSKQDEKEPLSLPIRIGSVEATAISMGVNPDSSARPMTHDLLKSVLESLGGHLRSVIISDVSGTTFFAQLDIVNEHDQEMKDFHDFVEGLSPDDFNVTDGGDGAPQK